MPFFRKKIFLAFLFLGIGFFLFIFAKPVFARAVIHQNFFRWHVNKDAVDPTDPWPPGSFNLEENAPITLAYSPPDVGTVLRIRMSLQVDPGSPEPLNPGTQFKLQFGEKTGASCHGIIAWKDVVVPLSCSSADAWCGYDNPAPEDGAAINVPLLSVTQVLETYEEKNPSNVLWPIDPGQDGEWDWVIYNNAAKTNTAYCFRMIRDGGIELDAYNYYPELITQAITVSGRVYSGEGTNPLNGKTVVLKVNGTDKCNGNGPCTAETGIFINGFYSISNVDIDATNDVVTVFLSGEEEKAVTVTKANDTTSDITGLDLYQNRLIVRHESGSAITNTDLSQYDKDDDDDIHFTANDGALIIDNDHELHIWTGKTFAPGGPVIISSNNTCLLSFFSASLHIDDDATFFAGGAISIGGHWTADSGATFIHNNNDVTFTATGPGCFITANSQNFYNVIFNGSGGGWSFSSTTTLDNDLTMTDGILSGTADLNVNGGDVTGNGTITLTSGTFTLDGTGNFGGNTAWTFYNLTFGDGLGATTTTTTGSGGITVSNVLTISANQTLDAKGKTWTLSGTTGTPFVINGTLDDSTDTSTFVFTGNCLGNTTIPNSTAYNSITLDNAAETYVLDGTTSLSGDLTITAGVLDVTGSSYALNVKGSWLNTGTFHARAGTVTFNGTASGKTINPGSSAFYNLTFNGLGGEWTLANNNLDVNNDLTITNGTLIASTLNINLAGNLSIGANGVFTKGSGTFTFDGSGTKTWSDSSSGQDLGLTVVEGTTAKTINLGSSVKATKITISLELPNDTLNLGTSNYTLTLTGSGTGANKPLVINGTLDVGTSIVEYTGSSTTDITLFNYSSLKINGTGPFTIEPGGLTIGNDLIVTSGTLNLGGDTTVIDNLMIGGGTLDVTASNHQLTVGGSWTNSGGTFISRFGRVIFDSSGPETETITTNNQAFYELMFNNALGSWALQDALDVNGYFRLGAGSLTQAANSNINFGGGVSIVSTFIKASGTGLVIFDGNEACFFDITNPKQNLGNVHIGTSPNDLTLCTDMKMDSLTVNDGDTFYSNGYDIDVTNDITVNSKGILDFENTRSYICTPAPGPEKITLANVGRHWTVASDGIFLAGDSTVIFDKTSNANLNSGGIDEIHDFNNLTIQKSSAATVTLTNNLDVSGDLIIANANSTLDVSEGNCLGGSCNINVGGNWFNAGTFKARSGTVTFDAGTTGKTIDSGGTGSGKTFYNIDFNNSSGGWTIQTNDLTATNNFSLTAAASFDATNRTVTVNGNFTNLVGGTATTWTGSVLSLNSGTNYEINPKTVGDIYNVLRLDRHNTNIRMWNSAATTITVVYDSSLYSMDHDSDKDGQGEDGWLYIYGDYHTTDGNTDYWSYTTDFDGTALSGPSRRQVLVYLQTAGTTTPSVIVDEGGTLNVVGGGDTSDDITIVGEGAVQSWKFACYGTCNVQESTWNYLNLTGGTLTVINTTLNNENVDEGTLNVDWYLGNLVVDRNPPNNPIDTGDNDITISENSATPQATVWKWSGGANGGWGNPSTSQTTGTGADGKIPQPGTDGAIRIREYARTAAGYTFYKYNLYITWQGSTYGEYDYYRGYGQNYITSTLNIGSGEDECISESWVRYDIDAQNEDPLPVIDEPPEYGTWYNGMISGLSFTVAGVGADLCTIANGAVKKTTTATTVPYGTVNLEDFYDACQSLTVSTSASNGYTVTVQETDQLTEPVNNDQIADGNCDGGCNETTSAVWNTDTNNGFAYCMNDITGTAAETAQPVNWATAKQCGGGSQSFMIFPEKDVDSPDTAEIMKSTGPVSGNISYIGFRLSIDATQPPGTYSTTILYVITPNY